MEIKSEVRGMNSGQLDQTLYIMQGQKTVAYLDFSHYQDDVSVQYLWVDPHQRRQGLGVALLRDLQRRYPETEINLGSLTDDGANLVKSLNFKVVTDPRLDKLFRLQQRVAVRLSELEALPPEEMRNRYDEMNRLHDLTYKLEQLLWDKKPTKQIIETD